MASHAQASNRLIAFLLLLVGIAAIVWGTRITLDNAVRIAGHYRISDFFVGVVILAIGSDLPEIVVSIAAAVRQFNGIATADLIVGNALGSCLGQFGLVMAIAGILRPLTLPATQIRFHGGVLIASMVLLGLFGLDGVVSRLEGAVLVAVFFSYVLLVIRAEERHRGVVEANGNTVIKTWLLLIAGISIVVISADVIVESALSLARVWAVDQSVIGIAIIGVGTSLPELMISIGASLRARMALSVGNLIGSNVLDVLLPIGLAAVLTPISFAPSLLFIDWLVLLGLTLLVLGLLRTTRGIRRPQAIVIGICYLAYLLSFAWRT